MICLECHSQVRKAVPVKLKGGRVGTVCLRCYGLPANTKAIPARNPFWADAGLNLGIGLGLGAGWLLGGELVKRGMKFLGAKESNPSEGRCPFCRTPVRSDAMRFLGVLMHRRCYDEAKERDKYTEKRRKFLGLKPSDDWAGFVIDPEHPRINPLYEDFHGAKPKLRTVEVATPDPKKHGVAVGKATAIEYEPYGSSNLRGKAFRHEFGDTGNKMLKGKPILMTQETKSGKGKHFFFADEPKALHFSDRGIIA